MRRGRRRRTLLGPARSSLDIALVVGGPVATLATLATVMALACGPRADGRRMATSPPLDAAPAARFPRAAIAAIGPTDDLPGPWRRALDPGEPGDAFAPMPRPGPDDWVVAHPEPPQTWEQFLRSGPNLLDGRREVIYLLPLGEFPTGAPDVRLLADFAAAFFDLEARVLPAIPVAELGAASRPGRGTGRRQLLAPDLLAALAARLPSDAYCLIGLTLEDLYPDPSWNFVFGQASLHERVGVYSFARYDPAYWGEPADAGTRALILRRSLKILAHETGHMFGMAHCTHFACVMNGSNHLAESDSRPLHLCPVCLRKLHHVVRPDPAARDRALAAIYDRAGFPAEAAWSRRRAAWIER